MQGQSVTLVSRIMVFLLKTHHHQIVAQRAMRNSLIPLRRHLREALMRQKDMVGYNLAALRYMQRQADAAHSASFLENLSDAERIQALRDQAEGETKKRKRVTIKA